MKKTFLISTALFTLLTFTTGCNGSNEEVVEENNNDNLLKTEKKEQLPLRERIEMEMDKDTNSIENLVQGQFDEREIGFLQSLDKHGNDTISYSLTTEQQNELSEYIKSIPVKFERKNDIYYGDVFDFVIVRPQYPTYENGAHIGVFLDKKELQITGGEAVAPRIYKVLENEEDVFEKLESYFKLGNERINSSN
ncbi:hypothetical protein NYE67_07460 [Solibacillus sp. FSL W8-0474]|uniref:hypothetical protein n=1 Tax=Solibacillus sp. FSL W8-0474 TaxID=2975336 RepID=UPI0030FAC682